MKKILLSCFLILALCGCSNTADTGADISENTAAPALSYSVEYNCVGVNKLIDKCGYKIRKSTPAEPVKKNMPTDLLPSKREEETEPIENTPESQESKSNEPVLVLLKDATELL